MNAREDIKAYLDGELTPDQAAVVERLLASDSDAQAEAQKFREIGESLRSLARGSAARGLEETIARVTKPKRVLWPVAGAVAAVALLGILGPKLTGQPEFFGESGGSLSVSRIFSKESSAEPSMADKITAQSVLERAGSVETKSRSPLPSNANSDKERAELRSSVTGNGRPDEPPPILGGQRDIIRNADLAVNVKDAPSALAELLRSTEALGGYFENSNLVVDQERPVATATLRIPSERFEAAVSMIRGLGSILRVNIAGQDVTAQIVDYGARARVLANEEQSLISMLRSARSTGAILEIRQRLAQVRAQLESYNDQLKTLQELSSLSTISVELRQDLKAGDGMDPEDWFGKTMAVAVSALASVAKVVVQGLVYVVILSPIWLPVALIGRWYARRQPKP
ncbi:MAG: DUF4349 domain-containing protein [Fimbriimonadaceae bacterium]|nr:DUF4349 domain-containing protein [Fimbriimonadaceae bacterium]